MLTHQYVTRNKIYSATLIMGFLIFIIGLGWSLSYLYNNPSILIFAVLFSAITSFISYFFSDKITLAISGAKEIDRETGREVYNLVENLCMTAGIPVPKIYLIDDTSLNAFATGRNPKNAVICFTTGILRTLNRAELEGVTAHELSHIANYDIRYMTIVTVLVGLVTLLSDYLLRFSLFNSLHNDEDGPQNNNPLFALLGLGLMILSPLIATVIKLAVSRQREYLADASGAMLTRYPEGLANALEKISRDTEPLEAANRATAHLYISSPIMAIDNTTEDAQYQRLRRSRGSWLTNLFNTHPPIEERIARLRGMNRA